MKKTRRGFASMSLDKRTAIAVKGGAAVAAHKRSFAKDRTLAAEAGRKGGKATRRKKSLVSVVKASASPLQVPNA